MLLVRPGSIYGLSMVYLSPLIINTCVIGYNTNTHRKKITKSDRLTDGQKKDTLKENYTLKLLHNNNKFTSEMGYTSNKRIKYPVM